LLVIKGKLLLTLYNSLILPHLSYCNMMWSFKINYSSSKVNCTSEEVYSNN